MHHCVSQCAECVCPEQEAKQDKAVVLTTHSMEEAEVLCDRLGIFVGGRLVCIGNPKELTVRYGGYYVRLALYSPLSACWHDLPWH